MTLVAFQANADVFVSVASGNWTNVNNWEQNGSTPASRAPNNGDTIIISSDNVIEITANLNYTSGAIMLVQVEGTLEFVGGGSKLRMPAGSGVKILSGASVVPSGPGGGSSKTIEVGGSTLWQASDGTLSGPADLGTTPASPVPIIWKYFRVSRNHNGVKLYWAIESNEFADSFVIQRSRDTKIWENISSLDISGNLTFSYTDQNYFNGINYYRIAAYENGENSYSEIESINLNLEGDINLYPNPAIDHIVLKGEGLERDVFTLHDMTGKRIENYTIDFQQGQATIYLNNLKKGAYFIEIDSDHEARFFHFIKK